MLRWVLLCYVSCCLAEIYQCDNRYQALPCTPEQVPYQLEALPSYPAIKIIPRPQVLKKAVKPQRKRKPRRRTAQQTYRCAVLEDKIAVLQQKLRRPHTLQRGDTLKRDKAILTRRYHHYCE